MAGVNPPDPYRSARFWGGLLLIVAAVALRLIRDDVEPVTFAMMLTTGCILLGVDPVISRLR